jgi:hypothetical protein
MVQRGRGKILFVKEQMPDRRRVSNKTTLTPALSHRYLFSVVELVALRRVAPRPAAQRLPAN